MKFVRHHVKIDHQAIQDGKWTDTSSGYFSADLDPRELNDELARYVGDRVGRDDFRSFRLVAHAEIGPEVLDMDGGTTVNDISQFLDRCAVNAEAIASGAVGTCFVVLVHHPDTGLIHDVEVVSKRPHWIDDPGPDDALQEVYETCINGGDSVLRFRGDKVAGAGPTAAPQRRYIRKSDLIAALEALPGDPALSTYVENEGWYRWVTGVEIAPENEGHLAHIELGESADTREL